MRFNRSAATLCAAVLATLACDKTVMPSPDVSKPVFTQVFPASGLYDRTGDGLVDFEIRWNDSDAGVDTATFHVRALNGINGPDRSGDHVLNGWNVERKDSSGIAFHETIENLLHSGLNSIEVSVRDKAGNLAVDTIRFTLPAGQLVDSIPAGIPSTGSSHVQAIVICTDDRRAYATASRFVVVIDTDSLKHIGNFPDPNNLDQLRKPLCVENDPVLYVTYFGSRFDRVGLTWLTPIAGTFGSYGIDQSRANPNLLFVGEYEQTVGIVDRAQNRRVGQLPIKTEPGLQGEVYVDVAALPLDKKLYVTRQAAGGILVFEPGTGNSTVIDLEPELPFMGRTDAIELSRDGSRLYVALFSGIPPGIVEYSTSTDRPTRRLGTPNDLPQEIAISPSGKRMFVTTQDFSQTPSNNLLIDLDTFQPIAQFVRPRLAGAVRIDGGVAFRPDGKLVFVGRDMTIDIYLNRE